MNFKQTLEDIASQQDGDVAHDVLIHVHIGGGNSAIYRGMIVVEEDTVSILRTMYGVKTIENGKTRTTRWPEHVIPRNAEWTGHSEVPMHIRIQNVVMVEWAVNDYTEGA